MALDPAGERASRPLLTLGRVDLLRVQVGYRPWPEGPPEQQFLLDLPVPDTGPDTDDGDPLDETAVLAALEPALHDGSHTARHYSLHTHRWHSSWGASPGTLEVGLLVTAGTREAATSEDWRHGVTAAFADLLRSTRETTSTTTGRDAALARARSSVATAFSVNPDTLSLSAEEHHPGDNAWSVGLRTTTGHEYDVLVGLVDGYERSVWLRHRRRLEVSDSVGSE